MMMTRARVRRRTGPMITSSGRSSPLISPFLLVKPLLLGTILLLQTTTARVNASLFGGNQESTSDSDEDEDNNHRESVSFQGEHAGEHFTMSVEEGHQFKCFETKEELVDAVDRYHGYNHIDMEMAEQYGWPIGNWCTRLITDMSDLFYDHQHFNEDIGKWDTRRVTDMTAMFQNALEFDQDLSFWATGRVTSMSRMFAAAKNFNADITQWDVSRVRSTSYMFLHALDFNQDISGWNVAQITDMERMLRDARAFKFQDRVETKWKSIVEGGQDGENGRSVNTYNMLSDNCGEHEL